MGVPHYDRVERQQEPCKTPGAVYTTALRPRLLRLDVLVPEPLFDGTKAEQDELVKRFHDALLPAVEQVYREKWHLLAGKRVDGDTDPLPPSWDDL